MSIRGEIFGVALIEGTADCDGEVKLDTAPACFSCLCVGDDRHDNEGDALDIRLRCLMFGESGGTTILWA